MQVGDLVWARWQEDCMGIIIDITFDELDMAYAYRVKWWWATWDSVHESREYEEDLVTKEEKCSKQEI